MSGRTQGPWKWHEDRFTGGYSGLFGPKNEPVCVPHAKNDGDDGHAWFDDEDSLSVGNAQLIEAAPDLYEALARLVHLHLCEQEGISSGMPTREQWLEAVDKASKAITKAEGGVQ